MSRSAQVLIETSTDGHFRDVIEIYKGNYRKERWVGQWVKSEQSARSQGRRRAETMGFRRLSG